MARILTLREMQRPRRGRSFSLELPKGRPQNMWMQFLPWEVWAEVKESATEPLRTALGCNSPDESAKQLFTDYLDEFTNGRLLLRVIRLSHERHIPPGNTPGERQARMDRWLPPSWSYDDASRELSWLRPTRFACPSVHIEVPSGKCKLLVGQVQAEDVSQIFKSTNAYAHWQDNGLVWVFCRSSLSRSTRAPV